MEREVAVKVLENPDAFHVQAAQGWLELGDADSAEAELALVNPIHATHPAVLMLRWHVLARREDWPACVALGKELTERMPKDPFGWVNYCNALYFSGRTQEAYDTLKPAMRRFPENAMMPYNLACYACQLGDLDDARRWLIHAFGMGPEKTMKERAKEDPDLKALWDEIDRLPAGGR